MTTTRKAPYQHANGDNCWTKNCKIRLRQESSRNAFFKEVQKTVVDKQPAGNPVPPLSAFMEALAAKRIKASYHPTEPFVTFKYERDTQFASDWDDVTMASRGIIFNKETGEVVARPFAKFFNYNEPTVPRDKLYGRVSVTDKLDGSLGIGYEDSEGRLNIATSGSFTSDHAEYATKIYQERYEGKWDRNPKLTYMWEIIYPKNRVVVDYGDENDLFLIGAVNKKTGRSVPMGDITEWKGRRAEEYKNFSSLESVLNSPERENKEGFIVHYVDTDTRVKYKHAEYLKNHRVSTGVTSKTIWRMMRDAEPVDRNNPEAGDSVSEWKKNIPEEFLSFIGEREDKIKSDMAVELDRLKTAHAEYKASLPEGYSRKDFVARLNANPAYDRADKGYIISQEVRGYVSTSGPKSHALWDRIKPDNERTFWNS
jgi:RNA ligase